MIAVKTGTIAVKLSKVEQDKDKHAFFLSLSDNYNYAISMAFIDVNLLQIYTQLIDGERN